MKEQRFRGKFKETGEFVDNLRLMENDGWYSLYNYLSDSIPEEELAFDLMDRTFELTEIEDLEAYTVEVNKPLLTFREDFDIITPTIQRLYNVDINLVSDDMNWNFKDKMNIADVTGNVPIELLIDILDNEIDFKFNEQKLVPEFTLRKHNIESFTLEYEDARELENMILFVNYDEDKGLISYCLYDKEHLINFFILWEYF